MLKQEQDFHATHVRSGSKAAALDQPLPERPPQRPAWITEATESRLVLSPELPVLSGGVLPCMAADMKAQRTVIFRDLRHDMQMYNH